MAQFAKVCIEIRGLVPGTALRPADIHISLKAPVSIFDPLGKKIDDIKSVAFDITITNITAQHAIEGFKNEAVWPPAAYTHTRTFCKQKKENARISTMVQRRAARLRF